MVTQTFWMLRNSVGVGPERCMCVNVRPSTEDKTGTAFKSQKHTCFAKDPNRNMVDGSKKTQLPLDMTTKVVVVTASVRVESMRTHM